VVKGQGVQPRKKKNVEADERSKKGTVHVKGIARRGSVGTNAYKKSERGRGIAIMDLLKKEALGKKRKGSIGHNN